MLRTQMFTRPLLCGALAAAVLSTAACGREEPAAPVAEMQSETPVQPVNHPTTVTGCLQAGEAANTFVLTTAQTATGEPTATYQLHEAAGVNLQEHIGRQVEITGMLRSQQEIATRSTTQPAEEARGTTGTPKVATTTQLSVRDLDVESVREVEGECRM